MLQFLKTLSHFLESGNTTVTYDELAALADEWRDTMVGLKLLVPCRPGTYVVCDACHEDHVEEVTRIKTGKDVRFRIRCPEAGWVDVPGERLRQWTLDHTRLLSLLSEGIGPGNSLEEVIHRIAWRIGMVEIASEKYSIVLVCPGSAGTGSSLEQLDKKSPPARTIVVGTGDAFDELGDFAASLSLTSAFAFTGDRFEFQLDRARSSLSTAESIGGNVFKRRGEMWVLSFEGATVYLRDTVGMFYISQLLANPDRDVAAVMLLAARADLDPRLIGGSSGQLLDRKAHDEYRTRGRELMAEIKDAHRDNDPGRAAIAQAELDELTIQLAGATGLGGRNREKTDIEKVRKSVSEAVSRDRDRITVEHRQLGRHLLVSITSGRFFRYSPQSKTEWLT